MGAIFISYRREDTEGHAGRLFEDLRAAFGDDSVFMDVAGIEPGRDFRKVIDTKVSSCAVLLCLIGRHWLGVKDSKGRSRLDDPADFVRLETGSALRRDISVVPVLVHGASMPTQDELPADLKELAFRNAVELTHARWDSDMQVLITALRKQMSASSEADDAEGVPEPRLTGRKALAAGAPVRSRSPVVVGVLLAAVLAGGGFYAYRAQAERAAHEQAVRDAAVKAAQESERLAALKVQQDLDAKRAAEEQAAKLKADQERVAQQQRDEQDRIAQRKAEDERQAKLKADQERAAQQKAELERIARQKTEDERLARVKAEQERAAQLQAEQERMAAAKRTEDMRLAKLRAERVVALPTPAANPRLALQGFGTNGFKVRSVTFDDGNGKTLGYFKQGASGSWVETGPSGSDVRFQFTETNRDEWSVYLSDASSGKRLQLDLNTRKVMFAAGAEAMRGLYRIVMAQ